MTKRIVALLLLFNMLASIMLCVNGNSLSDTDSQIFTANAAKVDTSSYSVGDIVIFGSYEQDNDTANGTEPIEWIVLDTSDGKLLLMSKYGLFTRRYNIDYDEKRKDEWRTTWEKCKLRAYLNNEFYNDAFSADEREHICLNSLTHMNNPEYGTKGGNDTLDHVYLLSQDEFNTYVSGTSYAKVIPTAYAKIPALKSSIDKNGVAFWWLRTPGRHAGNAEYVMHNGKPYQFGSDVGHQLAVRPIIRIQQDAVVSPDSVVLSSHSMTVKSTDTVSLSANVTPADTGYPEVWSSSNVDVAKVDNKGKISIVGLGKTTITVKTGNVSDKCEINVIPGFTLNAVGGSVRVIDPYGLRFGIQLVKDEAYSKNSGSIVSYGTLIIPKNTLGNSALTISTPKAMTIPAKNIYSKDDTQITYTGVLVGIPSSSFDDKIVGRGYLTYKDADGTQHTIYSDEIVRTYRQVAESAYQRYAEIENRSEAEQSVYEKLDSIVKSINATADSE